MVPDLGLARPKYKLPIAGAVGCHELPGIARVIELFVHDPPVMASGSVQNPVNLCYWRWPDIRELVIAPMAGLEAPDPTSAGRLSFIYDIWICIHYGEPSL